MNNIIEMTGKSSVIKYNAIKEFSPIEDGSYIAIAKGDPGINGGETCAIILMIGPEGGEPWDVVAEYAASEDMLKTVELLAAIADKTLSSYCLCSPDDRHQLKIGNLAIEAERLRHVRRLAQNSLNTVRYDAGENNAAREDVSSAANELNDAKEKEAEAERELRAAICMQKFEADNERRLAYGLTSLTSEEAKAFIESHESYVRAFG